jgi:hypothetical protein
MRLAEPRKAAVSATISHVGLDGAQLDLPDESVDCILSSYTLCTIPDVDTALLEMATAVQLFVSWSSAARGLRCVQGRRTAPTSIALVTKSLLDLRRILFHLTCAVAGPRPEEASQTVATAPRHDVHVQMRDRLADDVVDCDEGSLRSEGID